MHGSTQSSNWLVEWHLPVQFLFAMYMSLWQLGMAPTWFRQVLEISDDRNKMLFLRCFRPVAAEEKITHKWHDMRGHVSLTNEGEGFVTSLKVSDLLLLACRALSIRRAKTRNIKGARNNRKNVAARFLQATRASIISIDKSESDHEYRIYFGGPEQRICNPPFFLYREKNCCMERELMHQSSRPANLLPMVGLILNLAS